MGRPALSEADKLKSIRERIVSNMRPIPGSMCWAHEGQDHYKMGRERRLKPRSAMWLASGRTLPQPSYRYWIGQKDTCTVTECVNPDHLEVRDNSAAGGEHRQAKLEAQVTKLGGVVVGPPPEGASYDEEYNLVWHSVAGWERYQREVKKMSEEWIAQRLPKARAFIEGKS